MATPRTPSRPGTAGKIVSPGSALVVFALYEALADDIVEATGVRVLPSAGAWVERQSWARVRRRLLPSWGPTVGFAAMGLAISTARAAKKKAATKG